jgi:hypothetical protein
MKSKLIFENFTSIHAFVPARQEALYFLAKLSREEVQDWEEVQDYAGCVDYAEQGIAVGRYMRPLFANVNIL